MGHIALNTMVDLLFNDKLRCYDRGIRPIKARRGFELPVSTVIFLVSVGIKSLFHFSFLLCFIKLFLLVHLNENFKSDYKLIVKSSKPEFSIQRFGNGLRIKLDQIKRILIE